MSKNEAKPEEGAKDSPEAPASQKEVSHVHLPAFVVMMKRGAKGSLEGVVSELMSVPGVEIGAKTKSFLDITIDEAAVDKSGLEEKLQGMGCEMHAVPQAQLIDPIPNSKIP